MYRRPEPASHRASQPALFALCMVCRPTRTRTDYHLAQERDPDCSQTSDRVVFSTCFVFPNTPTNYSCSTYSGQLFRAASAQTWNVESEPTPLLMEARQRSVLLYMESVSAYSLSGQACFFRCLEFMGAYLIRKSNDHSAE